MLERYRNELAKPPECKYTTAMSLTLELPDEVVRAMRLPAPEKKRRAELELACALYAQGVLSGGKAAQLAGMNRLRFGQELAARNIPRHYMEENLRQDLTDDGG